ncbi:hypothetical protein SAMN05216353_1052 [Halobacillus alkaliphilus]|uniref:Uncharacterized protein n=1 Tax=Halobacillus alkaliphilus TaxID=396056 RepID=A0A1I2KP95_9BACI|nr:hypothetical protein [Halobacillus alkaliphilus]SFF66746.1 hypothetical protein SAMN05216353_1052 [Halobacillus alkaliphilus]
MEIIVALFVIVLAVVLDFFWFDVDRKRWGWMKKWTKVQRAIFLTGLIFLTFLIYLGMSFY